MPMYRVRLYEVYSQAYLITAESPADAIMGIMDGQGDAVPGSLEYIETDQTRGLSCEDPSAKEVFESLEKTAPYLLDDGYISCVRTIDSVGAPS